MIAYFNRFIRDEQGQDLIEYTLVLAFIALAAVAIFSSMGDDISTIWTNISSVMSNAAQ
jgi:pilus assembly protein Flp/PilA